MSKAKATVFNPETGNRITVGGKLYKELVVRGVVERPGATPPIDRFVYLPHEDMWIRACGPRYDRYIQQGYIHIMETTQLVKPSMYNKPARRTTATDTLAMGEKVLEARDVLGIILSLACTGDPKTYAFVRLACSKMKIIVDSVVELQPLVETVCDRLVRPRQWVPRQDGWRPIPPTDTSHAKRFCSLMDGALPAPVARLYIQLHPRSFIAEMNGVGACRWYSKLVKEGTPLSAILVERALQWLQSLHPADQHQWNSVRWARLKGVLSPLRELSEELQPMRIRVDYTTRLTAVKTLAEHLVDSKLKRRPTVVPQPVAQLPGIPPDEVEEAEVVGDGA